MTLEEKLRAYAAKGELVHISLAFRASDGMFHANVSAASPAGGYSRAADKDPVLALEAAFKATPIKPPKSSHRPQKAHSTTDRANENAITAAVNENALPSDWTNP